MNLQEDTPFPVRVLLNLNTRVQDTFPPFLAQVPSQEDVAVSMLNLIDADYRLPGRNGAWIDHASVGTFTTLVKPQPNPLCTIRQVANPGRCRHTVPVIFCNQCLHVSLYA